MKRDITFFVVSAVCFLLGAVLLHRIPDLAWLCLGAGFGFLASSMSGWGPAPLRQGRLLTEYRRLVPIVRVYIRETARPAHLRDTVLMQQDREVMADIIQRINGLEEEFTESDT